MDSVRTVTADNENHFTNELLARFVSGFRTQTRRYTIYCIVDEVMETAFVGKSYSQTPKAQYYSHMRGEHSLTKDDYKDADITGPEYYVLEIIYSTGRIAFKHVLAWYHYFEEKGYVILTNEKSGYMVEHMSQETQKIYEDVCVPHRLIDVLTRNVEEPAINQNEQQSGSIKKDRADNLTQFNVRIRQSVVQAFRDFCKERNVTQNEGLRLLLMSEDFSKRDLIVQEIQQEINAKDVEIASLEEQNKELLVLQHTKESWALHQRKEWVRIAKELLSYVVKKTVMPQHYCEMRTKPFGFKSAEGQQLFHTHQYPSVGGCYEVTVEGLVRGSARNNTSPDQEIPLFVCGMLNK